jgi:hypothetical protein
MGSSGYLLAAVIIAAGIFAPPAAAEDGYPQHMLTKGPLKLAIYLPDATKGYYRGTRFDWSGLVGQAEKDGHTFFGPWKEKHDPTNPEDADAVAEEFGINQPLGYSEAKLGARPRGQRSARGADRLRGIPPSCRRGEADQVCFPAEAAGLPQ